MPRYLFLCPDRRTPSGGIAVIYDAVSLLCEAGHDAAIVQDSPKSGYSDYPSQPPLFFTDALSVVDFQNAGWRRTGLKKRLRYWQTKLSGGPTQPVSMRSDDIVVAPEMMLHTALEAFPTHQVAVLAQNPFSFMRCFMQAEARNLNPRARVAWAIGTSEICKKQLDLVGLKNTFYLPVSMKPEDFPFQETKRKLITYMPRKRPGDAAIVDKILRYRGNLSSYEMRAIDNLPRQKVSGLLQQSLVFISLMKNEGLGFPAAEAMSAGCITVGFTGLGGDEFFTSDTGIPITEGDTAALITGVEAAIKEYETDPARLDAMRVHASKLVNARYSKQSFDDTLLRIWSQIEGQQSPSATARD